MQRDDKRQQRKDKRAIKKAGGKKRRQFLKRQLDRDPEEAAHSEFEFGKDSSAEYNGMDDDQTRRKDSK